MDWLKARFTSVEQSWNTQPAIRLAASYTLILLVLSLIFSAVLYHFAADQLARGLNHQYWQFNGGGPGPGNGYGPGQFPTQVQTNLDNARHGLVLNLVYFNLFIVVLGAILSYFLAKRTMRPIEQALESQRRFASDASHELRTPLAVMQTEIEIARSDPKLSHTEALALIDSNLDEVKKLHRLSDSLLKLARSEGQTLILATVSLSAVAAEAVNRVASAAKANKITLVNDTADVKAVGDHDSLVDLAAILLDNAIKYSQPGQVVTLTTNTQHHSAWLTVTDTGAGISPADLPHIFDRFYRADKARTGSAGHGLGLSLAHHIADLNQAEVVATSRLGHGSKFSLKIRTPSR